MELDQLLDGIDEDLAWRKKEISELFLVCQSQDIEVLRKSLLLIMYSHWEGFVKNTSKSYLNYVSGLQVKIGSLTINYKTISMKGLINTCFASKDTLTLSNELSFISKFSQKDDTKFKLPAISSSDKDKSLINTQDNLSPKVFVNFCEILGLYPKDILDTKKNYLDEVFLGNRNAISHGSKIEFISGHDFDLSNEALGELKSVILVLLDFFKDDIQFYATNEFYLKEHSDDKNAYDIESNEGLNEALKVLA
jgi:hypothetical protein